MADSSCIWVSDNVGHLIKCLQETVGFGDPFLMAIISILMFTFIFYFMRLPGYFGLMIGVLLTYSLYLMAPDQRLMVLMLTTLAFSFAWMAISLITTVGKRW